MIFFNYIKYKSKDDRETLLVEEYLNKIRSYLRDVIRNIEKSGASKIQLTITLNFICPNDGNDEKHVIHSKRDNIEILINDKADEVIKKLFKSLQKRHQIRLEESMKCSEFVFDYVHLFYYKCYKINSNRGESYRDSPDWIKNKKTTINPVNICFQYVNKYDMIKNMIINAFNMF